MLQLLVTLQTFLAGAKDSDDKGATMVEYGLLVVLIALVVAVGATALGTSASGLFTRVAGQL